jgi:hypothetical protein
MGGLWTFVHWNERASDHLQVAALKQIGSHEDTKMSCLTDMSVIIVGDALEAILEGRLAKIHEQAKRQVDQAKLGEQLLRMHRRKSFDRLDFNDKNFLDQQIDFECVVNDNATKFHCHRHLPSHRKPGMVQRSRQQCLISGIKQTRPNIAMNSIAAIDDDPGYALQFVPARYLRVFV